MCHAWGTRCWWKSENRSSLWRLISSMIAGSKSGISGRSGTRLSGSPFMCAAAFTPLDLTGSTLSSHDRKLESIVGSGVGYGPASSLFSSGSGSFSTSSSPSSISSLSLTPSISFSSSTSDSSSWSWISSRLGSSVTLTSSIASSKLLISISVNRTSFPSKNSSSSNRTSLAEITFFLWGIQIRYMFVDS